MFYAHETFKDMEATILKACAKFHTNLTMGLTDVFVICAFFHHAHRMHIAIGSFHLLTSTSSVQCIWDFEDMGPTILKACTKLHLDLMMGPIDVFVICASFHHACRMKIKMGGFHLPTSNTMLDVHETFQ